MRVVNKFCIASGALVIAACTYQLGTLGGLSVANDINDDGVVVGTSQTADQGPWHATVYLPDGTVEDLGLFRGDSESAATAIANNGTIVGYSSGPSQEDAHAVLWDGSRRIHDLGQLEAGLSTRASGVNNRGVVVGFAPAYGGPLRHAWLYDIAVRCMQELPLPATALGGEASAVNDAGQIAGSITVDTAGTSHAVRWDGPNHIVTDLTPPAVPYAEGLGINSSGTVVGTSRPDPAGPYIATVWPPGADPIYLSNGGYPLARAVDINGDGVVVGYLLMPNTKGGVRYAARWKPLQGTTSYSEPELINNFQKVYEYPLAHDSTANAINAAGVAVGAADSTAVRYEP